MKTKNKLNNFVSILVVLVSLCFILITIPLVSAECTDFVTYYGSCEGAGDILVKDSQNNIVVEQLYSVDKGCYNNKYLVSVPGGSTDCPIKDKDMLSFSISGLKYKEVLWDVNNKYVELDLERPRFKPVGSVISSQSIYLLLSVLAIFVVAYLIFSFYKNKRIRK